MRKATLPLVVLLVLVLSCHQYIVESKSGGSVGRPSGRYSSAVSSSRGRSSSRKSSSSSSPKTSRRRTYDYDEDEDDEEEFDSFGSFPGEEEDEFDDDDDDDEEEDEYDEIPRRPERRRGNSGRRGPPPTSRRGAPSKNRHNSSRRPSRYNDEEEEDSYDDPYDDPRHRRSSNNRRRPKSVVPYNQRGRHHHHQHKQQHKQQHRNNPAFTITKSLNAIRQTIPDASTIQNAAMSAAKTASQTSKKLSNTVYREIKGLTSSELEQVMLKATRPDDVPVKGKHVERLVGVTYQISGRYDIYDAVLRKLWSKMAERDWRTKIKALYVLHRFSADGAPEHQAALKARLRQLRRTRDPKKKDKYFNSKQLLDGDVTPEAAVYQSFLSRYAHYVLLRAQCFGGIFNEISQEHPTSSPPPSLSSSPKSKSKKQKQQSQSQSQPKKNKPYTSTALRSEHLEASAMILKAGLACALQDGEECENTAIAVERVASDLIGLTTAIAVALNRVLKKKMMMMEEEEEEEKEDGKLIKRWCEFYSEECLPQTKAFLKKTAVKLDAFGLFLPSRMGASVSQDLIEEGLKLGDGDDDDDDVVVVGGGQEGGEEEEQEGDDDDDDEDGEVVVKEKGIQEKEDVKEMGQDDDEEEEEEDEDEAAAQEGEEQDAMDEYDEYDYDDEYYDEE